MKLLTYTLLDSQKTIMQLQAVCQEVFYQDDWNIIMAQNLLPIVQMLFFLHGNEFGNLKKKIENKYISYIIFRNMSKILIFMCNVCSKSNAT